MKKQGAQGFICKMVLSLKIKVYKYVIGNFKTPNSRFGSDVLGSGGREWEVAFGSGFQMEGLKFHFSEIVVHYNAT